jgi:transcriptional regulator of acetoin/glycerol metabolism
MKVSISQAAKMAGVQRSTFYRHIDEKGISLEDKGQQAAKS